jgi:hypothetical protein
MAIILAQMRSGQNLRCALDLAVSTFALDHPCPVSIHFCEQSRRHPGAGVAMSAGGSSWDRFLVWKVFRKKG